MPAALLVEERRRLLVVGFDAAHVVGLLRSGGHGQGGTTVAPASGTEPMGVLGWGAPGTQGGSALGMDGRGTGGLSGLGTSWLAQGHAQLAWGQTWLALGTSWLAWGHAWLAHRHVQPAQGHAWLAWGRAQVSWGHGQLPWGHTKMGWGCARLAWGHVTLVQGHTRLARGHAWLSPVPYLGGEVLHQGHDGILEERPSGQRALGDLGDALLAVRPHGMQHRVRAGGRCWCGAGSTGNPTPTPWLCHQPRSCVPCVPNLL